MGKISILVLNNRRPNRPHRALLIVGIQVLLTLTFFSTINPISAATPASPGKRTGQQMVYDPESDEIVLYGGNRGNGDRSLLDSTWRYALSQSRWVEFNHEVSPVSRFSHGMVYLPNNRSVFLFGGTRTSNYERLADSWVYHLEDNTWEEVTPNFGPDARSDFGVAYDSLRARILVFGGYGYDHIKRSDLWAYYPGNNTWVELNPSNHPPGEYGHSLLYRNNGDSVYTFGRSDSGFSNDIWEYYSETNSWALQSISIPKPGWRYWHSMEYSNQSDIGFLFGGDYDNMALDETWIFNFTTNSWTQLNLEVSSPSRVVFSMCCDSSRDHIYVYGGLGDDYSICREDFWKFDLDAINWEEVKLSSDSSIPGYNLMGLCVGGLAGIALLSYHWNKRAVIR